jgi:hypothetical protein
MQFGTEVLDWHLFEPALREGLDEVERMRCDFRADKLPVTLARMGMGASLPNEF